MTALPLSLGEILVGAAAQTKPLRCCLLGIVLALVFIFTFTAGADAAELVKGEVRVENERGFTRLVFRLEEAVDAQVRLSGAILVITFKRPVAISVDRLNAGAPDYISAARRDPDGSGIRIALARKIKINSIPAAERLYVDLLPENWTGMLPGLPQEVVDELASRAREAERQLHKQRLTAKKQVTPTIRVKVVKLPTFMRYIFDMPERASVVPERVDGKLVLNFDQQIKWDMADAVATLPGTLESIGAEIDFDSVAVVFNLIGTPGVRSFREDRSIVVDIGIGDGAAKPDAGRGAVNKMTESEPGPAISPPETVPPKDAPVIKDAPAPSAKPTLPPAAANAPAVVAPSKMAAMSAPPKPEPEPAPKVAAMEPPAHAAVMANAPAVAAPPKMAAMSAPPKPEPESAPKISAMAPPPEIPAAAFNKSAIKAITNVKAVKSPTT